MINLNNSHQKILKSITFAFFLIISACTGIYACEREGIDLFDANSYKCRGNFQDLNYYQKDALATHCDAQIKRYKNVIPDDNNKKQYAHFLIAIKPFAEKGMLLKTNTSNFKSFSAIIFSLPTYYENTLILWSHRKCFMVGKEEIIPQNLLHFTIERDGEVLRDKQSINAQSQMLRVINSFARELFELKGKVWIHEKQVSKVKQYIDQYTENCTLIKEKLFAKNSLEEGRIKGILKALITEEENIKVRIQTWKETADTCQELREFLNQHREIIINLGDNFKFQMDDYTRSVFFLKILSPSIHTSFYFENIDESYNVALSLSFIQGIIKKLDNDIHLAFTHRMALKTLLKDLVSTVKKAKNAA